MYIRTTWKTNINDCALNTINNKKCLGKKVSTVALIGKKKQNKRKIRIKTRNAA